MRTGLLAFLMLLGACDKDLPSADAGATERCCVAGEVRTIRFECAPGEVAFVASQCSQQPDAGSAPTFSCGDGVYDSKTEACESGVQPCGQGETCDFCACVAPCPAAVPGTSCVTRTDCPPMEICQECACLGVFESGGILRSDDVDATGTIDVKQWTLAPGVENPGDPITWITHQMQLTTGFDGVVCIINVQGPMEVGRVCLRQVVGMSRPSVTLRTATGERLLEPGVEWGVGRGEPTWFNVKAGVLPLLETDAVYLEVYDATGKLSDRVPDRGAAPARLLYRSGT